jgi:hypothetical protein
MNIVIVSHGIPFIRTGHCLQCGACGCGECPHHYERRGKHLCAVYDRREAVCAACSEAAGAGVTHESCIGFPDNPWIRVVREGICGYTFERVDGGSMDDLPFLNGEPYQWQ